MNEFPHITLISLLSFWAGFLWAWFFFSHLWVVKKDDEQAK